MRRHGAAALRQLHGENASFRRHHHRAGRGSSSDPAPGKLDAVLAMSRGERMAFWVLEFDRCVKCYACRQVCSMCYCERCIVDKNQPISIDPAPGTKGNFAWHIARAFHLAGRCIGCGA